MEGSGQLERALTLLAGTANSTMVSVGLPSAQRDEVWLLWHAVWIVAALCYGIQWIVYAIHAAPYRSEKYFDVTGSITFATAVSYSFLAHLDYLSNWRRSLVSAAVMLWCCRLGLFLFRRITRDGHDRRMAPFKANRFVFLGTWTMQGSWCFTVGLPAYVLNCLPPVVSVSSGLQPTDCIGIALWISGWLLQITADTQKYAFRNVAENKGRFITHGLWAWSRHPNYFGEMTLWFGLSLVAFNGLEGHGLLTRCSVVASPLFTVCLLSFVSGLPLLEKYADKKWGQDPAYIAYKKRTPLLVLMPPFLTGAGKVD